MGAQVEWNQLSEGGRICEFDLKKNKKLKLIKFREWADSWIWADSREIKVIWLLDFVLNEIIKKS